jgi:hypothetical protein
LRARKAPALAGRIAADAAGVTADRALANPPRLPANPNFLSSEIAGVIAGSGATQKHLALRRRPDGTLLQKPSLMVWHFNILRFRHAPDSVSRT